MRHFLIIFNAFIVNFCVIKIRALVMTILPCLEEQPFFQRIKDVIYVFKKISKYFRSILADGPLSTASSNTRTSNNSFFQFFKSSSLLKTCSVAGVPTINNRSRKSSASFPATSGGFPLSLPRTQFRPMQPTQPWGQIIAAITHLLLPLTCVRSFLEIQFALSLLPEAYLLLRLSQVARWGKPFVLGESQQAIKRKVCRGVYGLVVGDEGIILIGQTRALSGINTELEAARRFCWGNILQVIPKKVVPPFYLKRYHK